MRDREAEQQAMLKKIQEAETLRRVDILNHIQSLKEELAFRKKVHEEVCSLQLEIMLLQGHAIISGHPYIGSTTVLPDTSELIDKLRVTGQGI